MQGALDGIIKKTNSSGRMVTKKQQKYLYSWMHVRKPNYIYNIYIYTAHIITHIYSDYSDIESTHMAKACLDPCYLIRLDRLMQ